jgi:hypothetical protein
LEEEAVFAKDMVGMVWKGSKGKGKGMRRKAKATHNHQH